jgi:hypothetical protein
MLKLILELKFTFATKYILMKMKRLDPFLGASDANSLGDVDSLEMEDRQEKFTRN